MIRRPPRSTQSRSSAASDVYKRQLRSRDLLKHQLEQGCQVLRRIVEVHGRFAVAARSIDDREIQLLFGCIEFDEQVEGLVDDFLDTGILPIDLVDNYDRPEIELESFLEHEPRLRHRSLGGVDQEQNPVYHSQDTLYFATKVRVARRVDDVDLDTLPHQRHVLGDNGDAALPLEVPGVEDALPHLVDIAEQFALPHHGVDQRRLSVVDVCNNTYVTEIVSAHSNTPFKQTWLEAGIGLKLLLYPCSQAFNAPSAME